MAMLKFYCAIYNRLDPADVDKAMEAMKAAGEEAYVVGKVEAGEKGVTLC